MSAKPTISLSRWADLVGSFVTDAPSGLRDTGFVDATPLEADILNAELNQLYLWALYLSDGALSGDYSIDGNLSIATGRTVALGGTTTLTVGGALRVGGVYLAAASTDQTIEKLLIPFGVGGGNHQWDLPGQKGTDATLPGVATPYCFALHPGGAYLDYGSANGIFKITPGTLFMKVANADGVNQTFLPFTFDGTQQFPTIAAGGSDYRVDLLQIKIERVSGALSATLSTKQGTPAASPTIPTCDTGFVPVGFVLVGASWTNATQPFIGLEQSAGAGQAVLYDCRMPVGVRAIRVDPVMFKLETAWALANQNQVVTNSNGTNKMYVPFANAYSPGRIIGVGIENIGAGTATPTNAGLLRVQAGVAPSVNFIAGHTFGGGTTGASSGSSAITRYFRRDFEDNHVPMGSGPVIQRSATEQVGVPLWTNGYRCPQDPQPQASAPFGNAALSWVNTTNGVSVGGVWFAIAGGLS